MATLSPTSFTKNFNSSVDFPITSFQTFAIFGPKLKTEQTHFRLSTSFKGNRRVVDFENTTTVQTSLFTLTGVRTGSRLELKAMKESPGLTQKLDKNRLDRLTESENGCDLFQHLKHRFLRFKKHKFEENLGHFQNLAEGQAPKFMIIACADSRVCPSVILGFQPGEAFMVRNVANLVPPFEGGPSETNAALEFAVNSLKVENILVIGHSRCGGIRALMSMQDEVDSSFIRSWVIVGKNASLNTKSAASHLGFDQQCKHCEKESVDHSLLNLLTYPWIEQKVAKGELSLHGGYYDFVDCTFEKWTLDYKGSNLGKNSRLPVKNRFYWC
ncbi:beta carbonic anhydrase 5, chloroplastic isoform X2 [Quercus lobata]|uniref:beta carbonic anhydrase 5, chloroplastic isoform X2 n=1 Tax=Quercus lobata TaxID=97700 RepID=UPI0012490C50|nr:beta carbonic anhydrase 5, chloroplastic isoform X2 [Quercus lobata]